MAEENKTQPNSEEKEEKNLNGNLEGLQAQCKTEYDRAYLNQKPKKDEWELRLKLYNNQRRDKAAVGDTTLFTTMQTVVASLYDDKLTSTWVAMEEGDIDAADNLNALAKNDFRQMEMDKINFNWIWNTCFYGRAYVDMAEFKREPDANVFYPMPEVWDPMTFLRDERASSVNGDSNGKGAARYYGREVKMTKAQILSNKHKVEGLNKDNIKFGTDVHSLLARAEDARNLAQGRQVQRNLGESSLGGNSEFDVLIWYTHWEMNGKLEKVKLWVTNDRSLIVGFKKLDVEKWTLIDRVIYPTPNDWDSTSICDLVEDKQRARAILANLALKATKSDVNPMYIFDSNKVENRKDLKFGFDKYIPVDPKGTNIQNAVVPLTKARPNLGLLDFVYTSQDVSAQKATATPEIQQGQVTQEQRTATELNIVSTSVKTRFSLSAKIFGWSEKRFWQRWYAMYKTFFKEGIDEKIIRISGAFGPEWRPLMREDIITELDPDVMVESSAVARAKNFDEMRGLESYLAIILRDPTANVRYIEKKLGSLKGIEKDDLDRMLPPTVDERIAEDQNKMLNIDKIMPVLPTDDHNVHLEVHAKANPTAAALAHIETHKQALTLKKVSPEFFPEDPDAANFQEPGTERVDVPGATVGAPATPGAVPGQPVTGA